VTPHYKKRRKDMYRKRMPRKKSKKVFAKTAMKVNKRNHVKPMRGGYRI
jgi:hypothetical protein